MSDTHKTMRTTVGRECVVSKKCDACGKDIPPSPRTFVIGAKVTPYFHITTHHDDWDTDSIDSYEYMDACCPECAMKIAGEYIGELFDDNNSRKIEIAHEYGWCLPMEPEDAT